VIRYLSAEEVIEIHRQGIETHGGSHGILSLDVVQAATQQPRMAFGGQEFYPTIPLKTAAIGYSLIKNHAFVDGNKRVGFTSMKVFLFLNGLHLRCSADVGERMVLDVIQGRLSREQLGSWIEAESEPNP